LIDRLNTALERVLPERRLFLRSDTNTRFVRLRPVAQAVILGGAGLYMAWSLVATAVVIFGVVGSADLRESARREQSYFESRLNELAAQRTDAAREAQQAHARYGEAMDRVAAMQDLVLSGEERSAELERGIDALQASLRGVMVQRDAALTEVANLQSVDTNAELARASAELSETRQTLDFMMAALDRTASERESVQTVAENATNEVQHLALEYRLIQDRNTRIFTQLENAVESSMVPLERVFNAAGLSTNTILQQVRNGYQQRSSSLMPISVSTTGTLDPQSDEVRANSVLAALEEIDAYRIALQRTPFAMPIRTALHVTSSYGYRVHPITHQRRMHDGVDMAGSRNQAVRTTADGVVSFAGRQNGYGNIVIVRHDFGFETRYAHLNSISVSVGQRVSRGDRIGGMGSTGRSTGVHLHYEIRVNGRTINPLTYIRAAQNVF